MLLKRYIHTIFEHFAHIRYQKHQEFTKLSKFAKIVSVLLQKKQYLCSRKLHRAALSLYE